MSYDHPYSGDDSNLIKKHWNGDYSLARSYWGNTLVVSVLILLGAKLLVAPFFTERTQARYVSLAVLFLTTLSVVVWWWAVTGTWRSASKHVSRGGSSFWAAAAKVAIVLGAIRLVGNLAAQAPFLEEHFRVARGEQLGPETSIQRRADGYSLLVSGGINDDTAEKLQQALNQSPGVRTIVLSSSGGWVGQGLVVAAVISSRKLSTDVEDECSSACTIAFLAGLERVAGPKARIGFHSFSTVGRQSPAGSSSLLQKVYREAGLSDDFIAKVSQTPPTEMWYPTVKELLQNGVLTGVSIRSESTAGVKPIRNP